MRWMIRNRSTSTSSNTSISEIDENDEEEASERGKCNVRETRRKGNRSL